MFLRLYSLLMEKMTVFCFRCLMEKNDSFPSAENAIITKIKIIYT